MNVIKQILILGMSICSTIVVAQKTGLTTEQKAQMEVQLNEYSESLNLSQEQKPKFKEITKRYGRQMMKLKESDKGRLSKYNEFRSIRKKKDAEMKSLLSNEQYKAYLQTQEEMHQKIREKN